MKIEISESKVVSGRKAADAAAEIIRGTIAKRGEAYVILATGASQFEMLSQLITSRVDWSKVTVFHLDEYIGLPATHPASFRKYLKERFADRVPSLRSFNYVAGDAMDPVAECRRLSDLIRKNPICVACIGIGENGHLAFNDPPADFETDDPYLIVNLDEACRKQQVGEGWFATLADVPERAISMSVRHIMRSEAIVCTVPDERKAAAVRDSVQGPVTNLVPASMLQRHAHCTLFLDRPASSLLAS